MQLSVGLVLAFLVLSFLGLALQLMSVVFDLCGLVPILLT